MDSGFLRDLQASAKPELYRFSNPLTRQHLPDRVCISITSGVGAKGCALSAYTSLRARPVKTVNGGALKVCSTVLNGYVRKLVALALTAALVSACGVSQITSPFRSKQKRQNWEPQVSEARLLEAARTDTSGQVSIESAINSCPQFKIWPRDRLLTVYDVGRVGDALAIQYRGEITKTARECQIQPNHVTVKYGFAGRVLLGPRGRPGPVRMPVKVHVTDHTRNIVSTQDLVIDVTIPSDKPIGYFSAVRELSFALPQGVPPGDFKLFIAFDRAAPGTG